MNFNKIKMMIMFFFDGLKGRFVVIVQYILLYFNYIYKQQKLIKVNGIVSDFKFCDVLFVVLRVKVFVC